MFNNFLSAVNKPRRNNSQHRLNIRTNFSQNTFSNSKKTSKTEEAIYSDNLKKKDFVQVPDGDVKCDFPENVKIFFTFSITTTNFLKKVKNKEELTVTEKDKLVQIRNFVENYKENSSKVSIYALINDDCNITSKKLLYFYIRNIENDLIAIDILEQTKN